jgi:tetratricopeptide (TPR) repeat protein
MKTSDDLFQLIKSLSAPEKRYFKLQASLYAREKKYLMLFDAIDAQEHYDEDAIKERFRNERFVRQFNVVKKYLFDQILKSLRANNIEASVPARIGEIMQSVAILFDRGLRDQARKMYEKGAELARRHERFAMLLEISPWIEVLYPDCNETEDGIESMYGEIFANIDRVTNLARFELAERRMSIPLFSGHIRTQRDLDALDDAAAMVADLKPASVRARMSFALCMASYHFARAEYEQALEQMSVRSEIFESNPHLIDERPFEYIGCINNQLTLLRRLGRRDEFVAMFERLHCVGSALLERLHLYGPRSRASIFSTIAILHLLMLLDEKNLEAYPAVLQEVEKGLREHERNLRDHIKLRMFNNLTLAYVDLGDFGRALHYNNRVLASPEAPRGASTYYHARLIHLVLHFELGNVELLEYLIKSTYRYFRSRNIIHKFERIVLDFFRKLPRLHDRGDLDEAFAALYAALEPLQYDPLERDAFRSFGYLTWLRSKMRGGEGMGVPNAEASNQA